MLHYQQIMENTGIIPVIKLENTADAVNLCKALRDGGVYCAEVTYRAEGADKVISQMTEAFPDMLIGAGTVLTVEQVDKAISAGAKFCVAPGLNAKVVKHCLDKGIPFVPGVSSPSQIEQAMELGLDFVKFFPAEQAGGLAYIKAISAPYFNVKFMPTGGINENNLNSYLSFNKIVCCGGSWIVPDKLVKEQKWEEITQLCKNAISKMLGYKLIHIGINCANTEDALSGAKEFQNAFGFETKEGKSSVFADTCIEFMKSPFRGTNGHIALGVYSVSRALFHLERKGYKADMSSAKYDESGKLTIVYLQNEINGFAIHLIERKD
ncbi:MAG: bifunctional 4-hydroxy-2-oxoglutarate aldolase/2-dehydro-3-deoxy-phosphogluconate aldolase [Clostridia bacterium]